MSWSELDIPDPEWEGYYDDCERGAAIHSFGGLKSLLTSLGYHVGDAVGYKAIDVADVTQEEVNSGAIEFTNDGIFVNSDGVRRQVFMYKRDYHLELYGTPRAHIRKCEVIDRFSNGNSVPLYRRANTDVVQVLDMDNGYKNTTVSNLRICSKCVAIAQEAFPGMTAADFIELLKNQEDYPAETDVEVDIFGYTKDWEIISRGIRETHNFTCENCGLHITDPYDQHFIHVHHKNGRKVDNRESNLQCLCLRCHANIDDHHNFNLTRSAANRIIYEEFCRKYPENSASESEIDNDLPF